MLDPFFSTWSDAELLMLWGGLTFALVCLFAWVAHLTTQPRRHPMARVTHEPSRHCERSVYHRSDWWRIQRTTREVK